MKLKIMYGSKTSKTADLDTISIQIFYIHMYYVYGWWLLSRGAGDKCPPPPRLNETLVTVINPKCMCEGYGSHFVCVCVCVSICYLANCYIPH